MKKDCPYTRQPCHTCPRTECRKLLDIEAERLFKVSTPITRDVVKLMKER